MPSDVSVVETVPSEHTLLIRGDASSDQAGIIVFCRGYRALPTAKTSSMVTAASMAWQADTCPQSSRDVHKFTHFYFSQRST